ncbi:MAG: TOBE domain-containing protein [Oscillatoriales cyanobacterium SM2_2_1]|nr:TOBE domain-containing protein [Oscillatoriales cyanobacterium SM2_2_1]
MNVSARNLLKGTIKSLVVGVVSAEVVLEVAPGVEVAAVITKASSEKLGLTLGQDVYAVIKASDVMLAVD